MNNAHDDKITDSQQQPEEALCPNCLTPNDPRAYFCRKCATPMSSFAVMDPIGSIWARGDTWHKAASRPTRPIILLGMWLMFGPLALFLLWFLLFYMFDEGTGLEAVITLGLVISLFVLYSTILLKTTRNYLRLKASQPNEAIDAQDTDAD